jgi:hypothetical protein
MNQVTALFGIRIMRHTFRVQRARRRPDWHPGKMVGISRHAPSKKGDVIPWSAWNILSIKRTDQPEQLSREKKQAELFLHHFPEAKTVVRHFNQRASGKKETCDAKIINQEFPDKKMYAQRTQTPLFQDSSRMTLYLP